jgi:hypothetical protein
VKKIPFILLFFFLVQFFVNLNGSLTVFPFLHFGMFSEKIMLQSEYDAYQIEVDGVKLIASDFSIQDWEMIQTPIQIRTANVSSNDNAKDRMYIHYFLRKMGLQKIDSTILNELNNEAYSDSVYYNHYKTYLSHILDKPIEQLKLYHSTYAFKNGTYLLIQKTPIITL